MRASCHLILNGTAAVEPRGNREGRYLIFNRGGNVRVRLELTQTTVYTRKFCLYTIALSDDYWLLVSIVHTKMAEHKLSQQLVNWFQCAHTGNRLDSQIEGITELAKSKGQSHDNRRRYA